MSSSERLRWPETATPDTAVTGRAQSRLLVAENAIITKQEAVKGQENKRGFTGHLLRLGHLVAQLTDTVLEAVQLHCDAGCTSREIAAITGLRSHVVAPRLSELQAAGSIAKIGRKWDSATERSNALFAATGGAA